MTDRAWATVAGGVILGLVAITLFIVAALLTAGRRQRRALAERRALHPQEPWRWTPEWDDGRIAAVRERTAAGGLLAFALMWSAVVLGAGVLVHRRYGLLQTPSAGLSLLPFVLAGLFLIGIAVYQLLLAMKFTPSVLQMNPWPGVLGGRFAGFIQLPPNLPEGTEATVALACVRVHLSSKSSDWTLWRDDVRVPISGSGLLPVSFTVPFDLPPSTAPGESGGTRIDWRLTATAKVPGVDWSALFFQVPVFQTETSDPSIQAGSVDAGIRSNRPPDAKADVLESGPERTVIVFPPAKGLGCGITAVLLLPLLAWPVSRFAGLDPIATVVAFAIGLLAGGAVLALSLLAVVITAIRLEIDREALRVRHGRGRLGWTRTIPLRQIDDVKYVSSGSSPSQRVDAYTRDGKSYWISGDLSGLEEAKWLAAEVSRRIDRHRTEEPCR
jgi:hypothetical protein